MKTSCVQKPKNEPLVIIHQWQLEFCDGNIAAAALMSFFEYWHNYKLDEASRQKKTVTIDGERVDISLYQFHKFEHLRDGILGIAKSKATINNAIDLLVDRGVITIHGNPNPRFKFDNTRHFVFHPEVCNAFLEKRRNVTEKQRRSELNDDRSELNDDRSKLNDDRSKLNEQVQRLQAETTSRDYKQRETLAQNVKANGSLSQKKSSLLTNDARKIWVQFTSVGALQEKPQIQQVLDSIHGHPLFDPEGFRAFLAKLDDGHGSIFVVKKLRNYLDDLEWKERTKPFDIGSAAPVDPEIERILAKRERGEELTEEESAAYTKWL